MGEGLRSKIRDGIVQDAADEAMWVASTRHTKVNQK